MKTIMEKAKKMIRIALGLVIAIFGLNGFMHFMPTPPVNVELGRFLGALGATNYMFPLIATVQTVSGALLLVNKWVPLALVVLFTVQLNAFLAHLFLDPAGIGLATLVLFFNVILIILYKDKYLELVHQE
jgi:hypothetical protein